jgi:hypothetical protein
MNRFSHSLALQAILINGIGTFSGPDGVQPAGPELRKFSRASAFGIPSRTAGLRRTGVPEVWTLTDYTL